MNPIETERLIIRNWCDRDRDLFFEINSDDRVMAFFPFRRDRAQSDSMMDRLRADNERRGYGFAALELKATGATIGFAGLAPTDLVASIKGECVEIGWRLAPRHWGKGHATEAANRLLAFGFDELALPEIVSFAVWNNHPSTAVMRRIGMVADPAGDFDHPNVPDTHPHLKRHVLYRLAASDWRQRKKAG
jgi:RimJ/RimL family protein N-acetyltransferase